ncbi:MAG TPA: aconitate hydratase AcnA [Actinomycetota bacterium]|nr:aconitate hydratase AcnA [Actinomycetota bacterium]
MSPHHDTIETAAGPVAIHRLDRVASAAGADPARLPHTVKILLENLLRRQGGQDVSAADVAALAAWPAGSKSARVAFVPARVLMQDFTGVPAVVDLSALRAAVARAGGDPEQVNPLVPVDLIIDHSVQVDEFGTEVAYRHNIDFEYRRNAERYALLRWAQQAFRQFRVVPPGMGICHQVNLEHLGQVVTVRDGVAFPDTLLGTDSHTTMINGLGILGWGVGGIEAEAAMLGQPLFLPWPTVVGVRTLGALPQGTTATDLVLTLTELLRAKGVVGSFVEFFGSGLSSLRIEDRATLSNMCPEYGATSALFPVDRRSLHYLRETGRGSLWGLVESYCKEQGLFRTDEDPDPVFSDVVDLDLSAVVPSLAGPRRPQDRRPLPRVWASFEEAFGDRLAARPADPSSLSNGSVVIASITSCTNTSNPSVMVAAGLVAKKAVEAGVAPKPWVKTSMAPGSRVVTDYLAASGLMPYLDKLGFNLVGYGCTTCIGNSGPLPEEVSAAVTEGDLAVVAVLSGNRNFDGRIHPLVRASYLASPPLVVAYSLAGTIDLDLSTDVLAIGPDGREVRLADLWPTKDEVAEALSGAISAQQFDDEYGRIFDGDDHWARLPAPTGELFDWDPGSTYVREPPYFLGVTTTLEPPGDIVSARVLVALGDSVTTDHISPAGSIKLESPAGHYLTDHGVGPADFNSYGSRRGNHEVMIRGTFANVRLRNKLAPGTEGPWTRHLPDGREMTIFDASLAYQAERVPLIVLAGKEYGSGSSRDWAAKGTALLGVKAVIAESYERIHRSNLVGMGILPLQFLPGESAASLGLTGEESFSISGIAGGLQPGQRIPVALTRADGSSFSFDALVRIDGAAEGDYYHNGGVLPLVLRQLLASS